MCHRLVPARYAVVAAAVALICSTHASAQRLSLPAKTPGDAPIVMLTGPDVGPAPRAFARTRSLARRLTMQQKTAIVTRAYPNGLPTLPPAKATVDPTGLTNQVILGPALLLDEARTAALWLFGADYRSPLDDSFTGDIHVPAGARFTVKYRPAKAGAPVMIECQLEGSGPPSKLRIKPYDQSAAVPNDVYVSGSKVLAFVVLPTAIGFNTVSIQVESGGVRLYECAVTPLS
jgi:hypothetical protein